MFEWLFGPKQQPAPVSGAAERAKFDRSKPFIDAVYELVHFDRRTGSRCGKISRAATMLHEIEQKHGTELLWGFQAPWMFCSPQNGFGPHGEELLVILDNEDEANDCFEPITEHKHQEEFERNLHRLLSETEFILPGDIASSFLLIRTFRGELYQYTIRSWGDELDHWAKSTNWNSQAVYSSTHFSYGLDLFIEDSDDWTSAFQSVVKRKNELFLPSNFPLWQHLGPAQSERPIQGDSALPSPKKNLEGPEAERATNDSAEHHSSKTPHFIPAPASNPDKSMWVFLFLFSWMTGIVSIWVTLTFSARGWYVTALSGIAAAYCLVKLIRNSERLPQKRKPKVKPKPASDFQFDRTKPVIDAFLEVFVPSDRWKSSCHQIEKAATALHILEDKLGLKLYWSITPLGPCSAKSRVAKSYPGVSEVIHFNDNELLPEHFEHYVWANSELMHRVDMFLKETQFFVDASIIRNFAFCSDDGAIKIFGPDEWEAFLERWSSCDQRAPLYKRRRRNQSFRNWINQGVKKHGGWWRWWDRLPDIVERKQELHDDR